LFPLTKVLGAGTVLTLWQRARIQGQLLNLSAFSPPLSEGLLL
jgi:hypothetical protein